MPSAPIYNPIVVATGYITPPLALISQSCNTLEAIADSGSDGNCFTKNHSSSLDLLIPAISPAIIEVASGQHTASSHTGSLHWPGLALAATLTGNVFPSFKNSLISIPKIVDNGNDGEIGNSVLLNKSGIYVHSDATGKLIMQGRRDPYTRFWYIPLRDPSSPNSAETGSTNAVANITMFAHRSQAQLMSWYSACMDNPSDSTML